MIDPAELRALFDKAVSLSAAARSTLLDTACRDNPALRAEVDRLLAAHDRAGSMFHTGEPDETSVPGDLLPTTARATLVPGARLGPYQITAALGAGGMGEVYKARDSRLDRSVAIKVLPPGVTSDPAARQRLEREARAAAALAHPHICTLLDIGREDDIDYLVMEYLDGETLAARLARERLPVHEALTYAVQIAEALDTAHQAGIVHRDLKPGNVMLTKGGAKLLDFGLAKRQPRPVTGELTTLQSQPVTRAGVILGTVQYMAPEQLEGKPADARTDIFAFGAVLYEMLTGRRAFDGASDASLIGNILHADPPAPSSLVPTAPKQLDDLVRRCLAKDPVARPASIGGVHAELLAFQERVRRRVHWGNRLPWIATRAPSRLRLAGPGLLLVLAAAVVTWRWLPQTKTTTTSPPAERAPVQRNLTRLTFDEGLQTDPTFSPDGRFIAYASDKGGNFDIWVQPVAGGDAVQVTKSPAIDMQPSWSPDGSTIAFRSERDGGGIYVVPALGGAERRIVNRGVHPSWSGDGAEIRFQTKSLLWGMLTGFYTVNLNGDPAHQIFPEITAGGQWRWIGSHPDGRVSFLGFHGTIGYGFFTLATDGTITDSSLLAHAPSQLGDMAHSGGQRFHWNSTGTALILETETNNGLQNLWKVHVNPATLEWVSVERLTTGSGTDMAAAVSPDGKRVVFGTQNTSERLWRFAFDPIRHHLSSGQPISEEGALLIGADVTADGRRAVYHLGRPGGDPPTIGIWRMDLDSRRSELLVTNAQFPRWSPNRRRIAYTRFRPETNDPRTAAALGALGVREEGGAERLISRWTTDRWLGACDWVSDNAVLACAGQQIVEWPVLDTPATEPSRVVFAQRETDLDSAMFSPNRRWISFVLRRTSERDRSVLGVTSAEGPPERPWRSLAPDHPWVAVPRWAPDGKTLYFLSTRSGFLNLWGVAVDPESGRAVGNPFAATNFESPAFSISAGFWSQMSVLTRQVFLTMHTAKGNIWMLDNVDR